jgi:CheY-like chemotaxis protein
MDSTAYTPNGIGHTSRPRLLLVDDNPDNLEILGVLLSERYHVVSCASAAQALAEMDAVRPDVVLLDIRMRPLDGLQCLQAIRARPGYAGIPAVAVTAFAAEADRRSFLAAGFQAVVTKPILDQRQLTIVIDTVLGAGAPGMARAWTAEEDAAAS